MYFESPNEDAIDQIDHNGAQLSVAHAIAAVCPVNIDRHSVRLIKLEEGSQKYQLKFRVDATEDCICRVMLQMPSYSGASGDDSNAASRNETSFIEPCEKGATFRSPAFSIQAGLDQQCTLPHSLDLSEAFEKLVDTSNNNDVDNSLLQDIATPDTARGDAGQAAPLNHESWPLVLRISAPSSKEKTGIRVNTQCTYASLICTNNESLVCKPMEQRLLWRGRWYLVNDFYGTTAVVSSSTSLAGNANPDDGDDDNSDVGAAVKAALAGGDTDDSESSSFAADGTECVVCLSAPRVVAVLPCRHMSLCRECGDELRERTNRCPICRGVALALLRVELRGGTPLLAADTSSEGSVDDLPQRKKRRKKGRRTADNNSDDADDAPLLQQEE